MTSDETQIQCSAVQINNRPFLNCLRHSGFSVLQIWPMFGSIFRFSHLKTAVFRFWCRFAGFLEFFFFGFRFSSTMMVVFRNFCPVYFTIFLVLTRKLHPAVIPRDHLYSVLPFYFRGTDDKPSLFSIRYLGCNRKAQDNIKAKVWDNILWTLTLDWPMELLELNAFSSWE